MATWQCVKNCGACCNLTPADRPELETYLTPEQLETYMGMVGADGWCINYDHEQRLCTIYEKRPSFCRVQPETFIKMFDITADELNDFAIDCCHEQIRGVYGAKSEEMERFSSAVGIGDEGSGN
ncbi:YkgJ family cysteine cluster protein [Leptothoe kymatousa]|uniref:YkgJ family cysteine cluster protein n=1 Tax=Leptothoe kymatousa TAU-MAC 1615 TaxID=2364775 RepID=A0ABS5Y5K1_9CYAN|nr:YkgJ family cysteine cluster protein [Leptothoe kymatousa]MBT9313087.1 YkgJ family cysteine cluster protein [Leptothoe kymatousa TAU-MAC 1615]